MAYSIEAIAEELNAVEFEIAPGKKVTLQRMSMRTRRLIEAQIPDPPVTAWKKDPSKGSESMIPDDQNAEYRAKLDECAYRRQAVQLCASLGLTLKSGDKWTEGMKGDGALAFADAARDELERSFSPQTYAAMVNAMYRGPSVGEEKAGSVEGN